MLPTLPARELSLLRCHPAAAAGSLPPWQLPAWHSTGSRPRGLGKFLTFALVSYGSWQLLGGPQHMCPRLDVLKCPIVLAALCLKPAPSFVAYYEDPCWAPSSPKEGVLRIGCQSRVNVGVGPNPVWHRPQEMLSLSGSWEPEAPLPFPSWTLVTLSPPTPGNVQKLPPWRPRERRREGLWGRLTEAVAGRGWCFLHNGSAFTRMCFR